MTWCFKRVSIYNMISTHVREDYIPIAVFDSFSSVANANSISALS